MDYITYYFNYFNIESQYEQPTNYKQLKTVTICLYKLNKYLYNVCLYNYYNFLL